MNTTCLINNYNYRQHVGEAVESTLAQSVPFEKIVVVDDGSTDGSVDYLNKRFGNHPRISIIRKDHGGQLSCFNRGIQEVSSDLVFFLDADDRYCPNYVETALAEYRRPEVEFLSVSSQAFGALEHYKTPRRNRTRDLGISVVGSLLGNHWVGEKTSCLSMRTSVARIVLPFPHEHEWVTRADDVLVFGSSAVGAYKRHLDQKLIEYRIHDLNHFANNQFRDADKLRRSLAINRLCNWFAKRMGYELSSLPKCIHREFRTRQKPTFKEWRAYQKLSLGASSSLMTVAKNMAAVSLHYVKQRFRSVPDNQPPVLSENATLPFSARETSIADAA